jgi:uncharacterized protein
MSSSSNQIENLVLNNRQLILGALNLNHSDIAIDNPYAQRKTNRQAGCRIDYLIQTKYDSLYVCEIKFSKREIGMSIIEEANEKIRKLKTPRNFSIRPVLIHCSEVNEAVEDEQYFAKIINSSDLLR